MGKSIWRFTFLIMITLMAVHVYAADQAIRGVVKDNSGAILPGVSITLVNTGMGVSRQTITNDQGNYIFTNIRVGVYDLKSELEGFQPVRISSIKVNVGDELSFPVEMKVSEITSEIEVKAGVQQVETTTSNLSNVVDERRITDLPLNGRNPMDLIFLTPGVAKGLDGIAAAVNGNRSRGNNYQLDGVDNNNVGTYGEIVDTNVDSTAEFRVITSNPSAEYGRAGGAIIDVVTKSGTNQFHGNAFWFHRNAALDAKTWAENYQELEKGDFKRSQFGGSLGGPIIKEKLFFFFNTELRRINSTQTRLIRVPTQAFVDSITNASMKQIFDQYYPRPNFGEVFSGINGKYSWAAPRKDNGAQYLGKIDYNLATNHTISARYSYNSWDAPDPWILPTAPIGIFLGKGHTHALSLDWTWIISQNMVNTFKFGHYRAFNDWPRSRVSPLDLVFSYGFGSEGDYYFEDFGGPIGYGPQVSRGQNINLKDTFSWNWKSHALKFGLDFRMYQDNSATNFGTIPTVFFDPYESGQISMLDAIRAGMGELVDHTIFSDGIQFDPNLNDYRKWRAREYDFFVQDDWKIRQNLTLNLGLRYEFKPPQYEADGLAANVYSGQLVSQGYHLPNQSNYFDSSNWDNGDWQTGNPIWVGQGADIYLAGPGGRPLYQSPKKNFAPRIGFSWDPFNNGKTAIRAGYGMSFDRMFGNLLSWNTSQLPFGQESIDLATTGGLSGIYPNGIAYFGHGFPLPQISLHYDAGYGSTMVVYNENFKHPYSQTWNFSVQRELWPGEILTVTYAGSHGVHLLTRGNPNQMPYPSQDMIAELKANGYTDTIPYYIWSVCANNTQFDRIHFIDTFGHSSYNALQVSLSHRFRGGLQYQVNYTWSKAFDNSSDNVSVEGGGSPFLSDWYDHNADWGYSSYDVRHNFSANFIYELPFGPGKRFGEKTSGILGALIGGWQINSIINANSGYPLDYKVPADPIGTGYSNQRGPSRPFVNNTHIVKDGNQVGATQGNFNWDDQYINFDTPKGDYYRGAFRGPGYFNVDFSLFKEVKTPFLTAEGAKIQFRVEAFNLFNRTNFTVPSLDFKDPDMGKTFSAYPNRQIQIGLKFVF